MPKSQLYPIFLSLKNAACLIAGFGSVGKRKLAGLLPCSPRSIAIFDPDEARKPDAAPNIFFYNRPCSQDDLKKSSLVFACANDEGENAKIVEICEELGILCDSAASPNRGSFIVPAVAREEDLTIAVSSSGASPALVRKWKGELETWLKPRSRMARLMKELRPLIISAVSNQRDRKEIFYKLVDSKLPDLLENDDAAARLRALNFLGSFLPFLNRECLAKIIERA